MSTNMIRRFINLWPPLLFSGIRVKSVAENWRHVEVELRLRWWNRNVVGTMFGGSLFAMSDPFFALMLQHNLGPDYTVWVKSAAIEFVAPGLSVALASFQISARPPKAARNVNRRFRSRSPIRKASSSPR